MSVTYRLVCCIDDPREGGIPWTFKFEAAGDRNAHLHAQKILRDGFPPKVYTIKLEALNTKRVVATYSLAAPTVCSRIHSQDVELPT
jgi:hypothetical protein